MKQKAREKKLAGRVAGYKKTLAEWRVNHAGEEGKGFTKPGSVKK